MFSITKYFGVCFGESLCACNDLTSVLVCLGLWNDLVCVLQDFMAEDTLEELFRGMSSQLAEREDVILCNDVRNKLFGPLEFSRRDLGKSNRPPTHPSLLMRDVALPRCYFRHNKQ